MQVPFRDLTPSPPMLLGVNEDLTATTSSVKHSSSDENEILCDLMKNLYFRICRFAHRCRSSKVGIKVLKILKLALCCSPYSFQLLAR